MSLQRISRALARQVDALSFAPPVHTVYDPLVYARRPNEAYLERFGSGQHDVLLIGMNPGPWGMAQTGVPFGEVSRVRDWMGIEEPVGKPSPMHPKRPIQGFACTRSEVSGRRLWGWAEDRFGTPVRFFARFFVWNYCPLAFLEASGKNRTPDRLPAAEREPLFAACDDALRKVVRCTEPTHVVGIGAFAEKRVRQAVDTDGLVVGKVLHPSPASPAANRGWAPAMDAGLEKLGITGG